jgi:hypothetical protein
MPVSLQRNLLIVLSVGLLLTFGVVAYSYRSALDNQELNAHVRHTLEVKEPFTSLLMSRQRVRPKAKSPAWPR